MLCENKLEKIRQNNLRVTDLLESIIDIFGKQSHPLTILELKTLLKKKNFSPNKTTLYRQVEKLSSIGILQESVFSDSQRRYCIVEEGDHHHHFYCKQCGHAEELPHSLCEKIHKVETQLKSRNFKIIKHSLEIEGLCAKCNS
ncbi:MAG: transcriptional repressor [Candidatus Gracilibacteria bacterium]|nr:transcriptional repressor [Candidatus Gracilibacteria bacterium]